MFNFISELSVKHHNRRADGLYGILKACATELCFPIVLGLVV
jgi:hypothetical protein